MNHGLKSEFRKFYLRKQGGRCAICNVKIEKSKQRLDHDHRTGCFRGVLCARCNQGLGHFCDSPELLKRALEYLLAPRILRFPRRRTREEGLEIGRHLPRTHKQLKACSRNGKRNIEIALATRWPERRT